MGDLIFWNAVSRVTVKERSDDVYAAAPGASYGATRPIGRNVSVERAVVGVELGPGFKTHCAPVPAVLGRVVCERRAVDVEIAQGGCGGAASAKAVAF